MRIPLATFDVAACLNNSKRRLFLSAAFAAVATIAVVPVQTASADAPSADSAQDQPKKIQPGQDAPSGATPEAAAEPAAAENTDDANEGGVERVVITATRRETILQKTPIAVTNVNRQLLEAARVENIDDLVALVPSLMITNNGNPFAYTARIRGVGTQGDNPGLEAAVGTFIDGVYRNRTGVAFGDLGELERVEVLRGPQGTLFGRNTSAGILNIVSKKPSFTNEVWGEATVGSFDQYAAKGAANFVLSPDELAARIFFTRHEQEGYVDVNPGRPDAYDGNAKSYYSGRGQILWQANANADVRLVADYSKRKDQCCSAVTINPGSFGRTPTVAFPNTSAPSIINSIEGPLQGKSTANQIDSQIAFGNRSTNSDVEDRGVSAELNWDFDGAKLTSITALRDWRTGYGQDADFSGADILYFPTDGSNFNEFETFTHESRITGEAGWVNWLFGAFYSNEDINRGSTLTFGTEMEQFLSLHRVGDFGASLNGTLTALLAAPVGGAVFTGGQGDRDRYTQNSESFALFTHNVFHLDDNIDLIAGLRWTTETKTFDGTYRTTGQGGCAGIEAIYGLDPAANVNFNHPAATLADGTRRALAPLACLNFARKALDQLTATTPHHQESEEDEFSGILTLAWRLDENVNTYGTYSRGHKAGGFNLDRAFSDANGSIVSNATFAIGGPLPAQVVRAPDTSFEAEFVDAFELGLKTQLDKTFYVNTAIFYQDFENFQLNTFTGTSFIVTSVPEVISKGVEVEAYWTPIKALTSNFAVQYTDARYGDIGSLSDPTSFLGRNPGLFLLQDATITHAPKWTLTGAVDYSVPFIDAFTARFHVDARWQSEMNTGSNLDPRKIQDAYAVVGLKLGVYGEDEWIGLEFFARNLFDENYINTAFDAPLQGSSITPTTAASSTIDAFVGEPRMIGATLRLRH
ncbi:MAG: TonB-dependent receptor [Alphaproteobacteria bacterium]|nr:TonB-dependent receptor [Alphaproteobacteria bacterium]